MNSLVSIIVVVYNSSRFVIETLESVSKQTWNEIELIITDDCSIDDTVELCKNWLNENSKRFVRTEILTSEINRGVPANANKGLYSARGEWIHFLAGDDTLKSNFVCDNMQWISSNPGVRSLFSRIEVYLDTIEPENLLTTIPDDPYNHFSIMAPDRTAESQYRMLLISDRIHFTPSFFQHRDTLVSIGGFDERFKILEDYPMWLNLTKKGYKLSFMDVVTVNYRQHSKAINNTGISYLVNPNYFKQEEFRKLYTYPNLPLDIRLYQRYNWFVLKVFRNKRINVNKRWTRFLMTLLTSYLNPFKSYIYLKKFLNKDLKDNEFYM